MEYRSEYMADYYAEQEPHEFVVVQERTILVQYTVEASSMINAIEQIESGDYSSVIEPGISNYIRLNTFFAGCTGNIPLPAVSLIEILIRLGIPCQEGSLDQRDYKPRVYLKFNQDNRSRRSDPILRSA